MKPTRRILDKRQWDPSVSQFEFFFFQIYVMIQFLILLINGSKR